MGACPFDHYSLPTIDFVGGETQELMFHVYFPTGTGNVPFPVTHCTARFAVVNFLNKSGDPVIGPLTMTQKTGGDGYTNLLYVKIPASLTVDLEGKFIYQITINEQDTGDTDIPRQGIMLITRNIDQ